MDVEGTVDGGRDDPGAAGTVMAGSMVGSGTDDPGAAGTVMAGGTDDPKGGWWQGQPRAWQYGGKSCCTEWRDFRDGHSEVLNLFMIVLHCDDPLTITRTDYYICE